MIPTLKSIFNFNQWKQVQQWVNNKLTLYPTTTVLNNELATKQDVFDDSNVETGTDRVTINAKSGVAIFTDSIGGNNVKLFGIVNDTVTSNSIVRYSLKISGGGVGIPVIVFYNTTTTTFPFNSNIQFFVYNLDSNPSTTTLRISFEILN